MFYLILAVIASTLISIAMRLGGKYAKNNISMLAANYFMCLVLSFVYTGGNQLLSAPSGMGTAVGLGLFNGLLYLVSFVLFQFNIKRNGVVLSTTFMKLGILVSIFISIVIFKEIPGVGQAIGFVIALVAIVLINFEKEQTSADFKIGLILLLVIGGSAEAMSKVYEELGTVEAQNQFLLFTFAAAFVVCVIFAVFKKQKMTWMDFLWGLIIGIPNYYSARFLLKALGTVPAVVAYPTYSVATIVLVSLTGMLIFKEKISLRQKLAIGIILVALVLLNI